MSASKCARRAAPFVALLIILLATSVGAQLLLDDSLQGSTSGVRDGGSFVSGGWQVTGEYNSIFWHLPYTVSHGAAEFYVTGINTNYATKTEHFHMYDYTIGNSDYTYNGGYRDNPYKHFIRKTGADDPGRMGSCEIVYVINSNYFELDTANLSWSSGVNYKMRVEWGPEGGNSRLNVYRDGQNILSNTLPGNYTPAGHSVRIACSPRRANEGSEIGAKYSYVKVWDMTNYTPSPPTVTSPANGASNKSNLVYVTWTGDSHSHYRMRICTADNPDSGIVWDSGEVASARNFAWTGALGNMTNYYVYVRIGNQGQWSGWSASGRWFRVDSGYAASNNVKVSGRSYEDASGPFLGLGFTYMASMWMCKNDRTGYQNELAYMSARGFNYQRILSEVPGACSYCYWWGRAINASTYQCNHGSWASPWSDYDQQLRDCIDIAYDQYGIRTEITVFGGAGESFPTYTGRQNHCQRVLDNLPGREHKVLLIEVANEAWQTGFPGDQGIADLRSLGQYLADRTSIPIALTAMCSSESDMSSLVNLYAGSAADVTTEHFSRDLNTDAHWYCVRDCWRVVDYGGLPPASSNEPIGPGSSVNTEDDPIHLVSAAAFAYIANLHSYVWHSRAGVRHDYPFGNYAAVGEMHHAKDILPKDVSSWIRNDGLQSTAPFTVWLNGATNAYWSGSPPAGDGCYRNIGGRKGIEFVCYPMGILGGGVFLTAREQVTFKVYNPLTGDVVVDTTTKNQGEQLYLSQGPQAYIIKGAYGPYIPGGGGMGTLTSKGSATITVDGNSSDWNLAEFTTKIRGGQTGTGDTALVGWDGGYLYYGSYSNALPTSASDHTAKIYSRNTSSYLYFLARCDDNDMRYSVGSSANWQNDCIEFYIDPANDGGGTPISNSSSDIQLVIDANNQKNVYMCTSGYTTQVLGGVTSAVVRDGTGWWLEARITKSVLDPDIPAAGNTIGLDFMCRDNDNNNDPALTTLYTWNDSSYSGFPSKIPNNWGDMFLDAYQTPYSGVIPIPGTVQAENYDVGGQNISYSDTTSTNDGGQYRTSEGVDIEVTTDTGGGYNVGWINTNEWMEYTVNVASTGDYRVGFRVATSNTGSSAFTLRVDGQTNAIFWKAFTNTGGWQNWTTVYSPAIYLTAGQHILQVWAEAGGFNLNYITFESLGADAVSIDLGNPDVLDGMTHIQVGDGDTVPWTSAGHYCRENLDAGDIYMYFGVSDAYAYQGNRQNLSITFDYYDIGTGQLGLDYDSTSSSYQHINGPTLTNTLTWKSYTFTVNNAYFGNRQNGGADFRITAGAYEWGIDTVHVYDASCTPPVAPTSASASPSTICSGASSTLTATGGSGTTLRWMTGSCGGTSVGTGNNLVVSPTSTTTYYVRWENSCGNSTCVTTTVTVNPLPVAPTSASASPSTICSGASSTLTATGGSGTTLRWMTGSCGGTSVGTGNNLVVSPTSTTTYYARWENSCGNSTCVTTTVTVNPLPVAPTSASASPSTICSGASSTLTATGGSGTTLRWMTGSCGGTSVGTGNNLVVSPTSTTTYYARWENSCGNSTCATTTVTVNPLPVAPTSASANPSTISSGQSSTLTATGGSGTTLRWMTGSCGGTTVGTGNNLVVSPTSTTTYYVRWENSCGNSTCATTTVTVTADTTPPTFGGSINPSTVTTLTPTITITAQDTGSGLDVGSAEFAYSTDNGNSFCTYVGRYVLHSAGTGNGGGNMYWYPDFYHPASYTIAAGDHLQYDIYSYNTDGKGAVDLEGSFGNLRDSGKVDQNGLSAHANTNLYAYAYGQWYHRDFDLSSWAGHTISAYEMAHETDSGISNFYVRNVIITNNGQVKDKAANADAWTWVSDTFGPGNNGYSSPAGPEMSVGDPASPASCTGTNGTTAQQTVSAVFSNRLMPLVVGSANRIKYHIRDMNGNLAVSGAFTLTVNQTVTLNNSTFDSGTDGWTLSVWRAATQYGYGTFTWGSTYGRTGGGIRNTGTGSSDNTDRCTREGGEAQKTISTVGYSNIKVYYDLDVNTLGLNMTGTGAGACAVDHNLIDEQITVYYSTNGGSSWTEAEYLLRSALLASYQSWGTRMIDLTGVPAVNNNANFRLRFRWQCNSGADLQALDNIVVTSN